MVSWLQWTTKFHKFYNGNEIIWSMVVIILFDGVYWINDTIESQKLFTNRTIALIGKLKIYCLFVAFLLIKISTVLFVYFLSFFISIKQSIFEWIFFFFKWMNRDFKIRNQTRKYESKFKCRNNSRLFAIIYGIVFHNFQHFL